MQDDSFDIRDAQINEEKDYDKALRPLSFDSFSGQYKVVENLEIFVKASKLRGDACR